MTNEFRKAWISDPIAAKNRNDLATMYRNLRKDNPALARLLFKRLKAAEDALIEKMFSGTPGGLSLLVGD